MTYKDGIECAVAAGTGATFVERGGAESLGPRPAAKWPRAVVLCAVVCVATLLLVVSGSAAATLRATPDPRFEVNGGALSIVKSGGTVYVGGSFTRVGRRTGPTAVISSSTAQPEAPTAEFAGGYVSAVIADGSGGWFVGGTFGHVGGLRRYGLVHLLADGTVDPSFDPRSDGSVSALALSGSTLYVGGNFKSIGGQSRATLAALDVSDGHATAWDPNPDYRSELPGPYYGPHVSSLVAEGPVVYVGGNFSSIGGTAREALAAVDSVSGRVTPFDAHVHGTVSSLALSLGMLYVGGSFDQAGGQTRSSLAALNPVDGSAGPWAPTRFSDVTALVVSGGTVYVAGVRATADYPPSYPKGITAISAVDSSAIQWSTGVSSPSTFTEVKTMVLSGSRLYIGGAFKQVGSESRDGVAQLSASDGNVSSWSPPLAVTDAMAVDGDRVFVGGRFSFVGGEKRNGLAAFDAATGNLTSWNPGLDAGAVVSKVAVARGSVYFGGSFSSVGGQPRAHVAAVTQGDGTVTDWAPVLDRSPMAFAASGSTIFLGGSFSSVDGEARDGLAAVDGTSGSLLSWHPAVASSARPVSVSVLAAANNTLYVGGNFDHIAGQARRFLAAVDTDTGAATAFDPEPDFGALQLVTAGAVVYAGGYFRSIGGASRSGLAALNANDGSATAWDAHCPAAEVTALGLTGSTLYIAGTFSYCSRQVRPGLAAVNTTDGKPTAWTPANDGGGTYSLAPTDDGSLYAGTVVQQDFGGKTGLAVYRGDSDLPLVENALARNVQDGNATIQATIDSAGQPVDYYVEYGSTSTTPVQHLDASSGPQQYQCS